MNTKFIILRNPKIQVISGYTNLYLPLSINSGYLLFSNKFRSLILITAIIFLQFHNFHLFQDLFFYKFIIYLSNCFHVRLVIQAIWIVFKLFPFVRRSILYSMRHINFNWISIFSADIEVWVIQDIQKYITLKLTASLLHFIL